MLICKLFTTTFLLISTTQAFMPRPTIIYAPRPITSKLHGWMAPHVVDAADWTASYNAVSSTTLMTSDGALDVARNIAIGITAILFSLAGLTYLVAAVIVPAAAKELEKECKELAPELWNEYQLKLEPGQTMGQRPDLMQELGAKIQPLLDAKIEKQFAEKKAQGIDVSKDEEAWKALDKLGSNVPQIPPPPASTAPEESSEPKLDLPTKTNQWD